jgi:nucleotide-binding universal stress UspA family protein
MNSILVPIDGSPISIRAMRHAVAQAGRGATVHILNVEPPLDDYGMVAAHISRKQHDRAMRERASAILRRAVAQIRSKRVRVVTHAVIGEVASSIVSTARRLGCRSIVMGTHGRGRIANLFLGSVATKVIHLARVPVTLVR